MHLIFLGPPGAGKGTQAAMLAGLRNIPHISTGDILRDAISGQTSLGIQAQKHVEDGELVPDILIMALMRERFGKSDMASGWLLDGFPRTVSQAHALEELLSICKQPYPKVIYFEVTPDKLVERMLGRGRVDDTESVIRRRLAVYRKETIPLIDFYRKRQNLVTIDGDGSPEDVHRLLQETLTVPQA